MTPDFTLIWPLSCLKDGAHLWGRLWFERASPDSKQLPAVVAHSPLHPPLLEVAKDQQRCPLMPVAIDSIDGAEGGS